MRIVIQGGTVVTSDEARRADILCEDGKIVDVGELGDVTGVDERFDAAGLLVFPGFIDPHVHSRDPGATHKEDFAHSTLSALCGGVTCVLEMPNAIPGVTDAAGFNERRHYLAERAWVDFGLWGLSLGSENVSELEGMVAAGAVAVKMFWGYSLARDTKELVYNPGDFPDRELIPPFNSGDLYVTMLEMARLGSVLGLHCEDKPILDAAFRALGRPIDTYQDLLDARPSVAESAAISLAAQLAGATGCRTHVVHLSSADGLSAIRTARQAGKPISAETCPHYLHLTADDYDAIGPMMKVYPPVRHGEDRAALWDALADGSIVSVGSDHGPHTREEKAAGLAQSPAGVAGVETLATVMVDGMLRDLITPQTLAAVLSTNTASIFGLQPRKGLIELGADADLTLVDPEGTTTVSAAELHSISQATMFDGRTFRGAVAASVIGGRLAMVGGKPLGEPSGRFVPGLAG